MIDEVALHVASAVGDTCTRRPLATLTLRRSASRQQPVIGGHTIGSSTVRLCLFPVFSFTNVVVAYSAALLVPC